MKTAILTFYAKDLVYACEQLAFVHADMAEGEDGHSLHQIFDIAQDGNRDRLERTMGLAFDLCRESLYAYTKIETQNLEVRTNELKRISEYRLTLGIPDEMSATTIDLLTKLVHELIVAYCLWDWLRITYPQVAETWRERFELVKMEIKKSVSNRRKRTRRRLDPF